MNDAAIAFALIAYGAIVTALAVILAAQLRAAQNERSEILTDVGKLESMLKAARKNDARDPKTGRFVGTTA